MKQIDELPRLKLGVFPTPFYKLEGISARYGRNIWIKRDDLCGVALGGNKVRKLEFLPSAGAATRCSPPAAPSPTTPCSPPPVPPGLGCGANCC